MSQLTITVDGGKISVSQSDNDSDSDQPGAPNPDAAEDQTQQAQPVKNLQALLQIVAEFVQSSQQQPAQSSPFDQSMAQRVPGRGAGPGGTQQQPGGM